MMKSIFTLFLVFALWTPKALADKGTLKIYGKTFLMNVSENSKEASGDISVKVYSGDSLIADIKSAKNAKYGIDLPFMARYKIVYGGSDFVNKIVSIDASDFSQDIMKDGYKLNIDMTVITKDGTTDFDFLEKQVFARAGFNKKANMVVFDANHTEKMYQKLQAVLQEKGWTE